MYSRLLVPVDGRPCSEHAACRAFDLAVSLDCTVVLAHVLSQPRSRGQRPREAGERLEGCGRALLERWERIGRERGAHTESRLLTAPDAAEAIADLAVDEDCDLIVLGTRGRQAASERPLLGRVAEKVARTATVPVMLVRRPGGQRLALEATTQDRVPPPVAVAGLAAAGWSAND